MNSDDSSPTSAPPRSGVIKLVVKRNVPSLNILFKMNPWQRAKEKHATQMAVLDSIKKECVLNSVFTELDSSTPTTSAQSILSTAYDTLVSYLTTDHKTSTSGFDKKQLLRSLKKELKLKSHQSKQAP
jgi:hypothetical protein